MESVSLSSSYDEYPDVTDFLVEGGREGERDGVEAQDEDAFAQENSNTFGEHMRDLLARETRHRSISASKFKSSIDGTLLEVSPPTSDAEKAPLLTRTTPAAGATTQSNIEFVWSLRGFYFMAFVLFSDLSIILPTLIYYLKSLGGGLAYYSASLYCFAGAQIIGGMLAPWAASVVSFRTPLNVCLAICALGNFLYVFAKNPWMVLAGRLLAGLGAGGISLGFSYIAIVTPFRSRISVMGNFRAWGTFGLIVSPGAAFVLQYVDFHLGGYHFSSERNPAWIIIILLGVVCLVTNILYKRPSQEAIRLASETAAKSESSFSVPVVVLLYLNFMQGMIAASFQFLIPYFVSHDLGWGEDDSGKLALVMLIVSVSVVIGIFFVKVTDRFTTLFDEHMYDLLGDLIFVGAIVLAFIGAWIKNLYPFAAGTALAFIGYGINSTTLPALYSKFLPPKSKVRMMGVFATIASCGRLAGPLILGGLAAAAGTDGTKCCLVLLFGLSFLSLFLLLLFWNDLKVEHVKK